LQRKAGEEGRLFGSVAAPDVVDSLAEMGITVQRSEVSMPNGPIKEIGEHTIEVILHSEVRKTLDIKVEWEQE
jgi:large subunit ribosomal protein L9